MRILHTSDWHLGQHFMGKTREPEHRAFLNWLLDEIQTREADALVVTGDIFDTGTPPSYARTLYNEFVVSLQATGCGLALILGGNHDSPATLNEGRRLLACLKTRVVAGLSPDLNDHLVLISDREGRPGLLICALPYLRPGDLVRSAGGQSGQEKRQALDQAIREIYDTLYGAALTQQHRLAEALGGEKVPIMVTGHLTVAGTLSSESVRDIYVGSLSAFPADGFPPAAYVALGHLHRAQTVNGRPDSILRYSGSPIPLSFDEADQTKQVVQADFFPGQPPQISQVSIPCFRTLVSLKGGLADIGRQLTALAEKRPAASGHGEKALQIWLEAEVTGEVADLTDQVQTLVQAAGLAGAELLRVRRRQGDRGRGLVPEKACRLEELNPRDVFSRRLALEDLEPEQEQGLTALFEEILAQVQDPAREAAE